MVNYEHDYWDYMEPGGKVATTPEKRWVATGPNGDIGDGMTQVESLESMVHTLSAKVRRLREQLLENEIQPRITR